MPPLFLFAVIFTDEEKEKMRNLPRKECILRKIMPLLDLVIPHIHLMVLLFQVRGYELYTPRLGKRELVCVHLVHLFVCFVCVTFCHFSLPPGVGGWLQFVIVALPRLFY